MKMSGELIFLKHFSIIELSSEVQFSGPNLTSGETKISSNSLGL